MRYKNALIPLHLSLNKAVDGFSFNDYAKEKDGDMREVQKDGRITQVSQYPIRGECYHIYVDSYDVVSVTLCSKIICSLRRMGCRVFTDTTGYYVVTTMSETGLKDVVGGLFNQMASSSSFYMDIPKWAKMLNLPLPHTWESD